MIVAVLDCCEKQHITNRATRSVQMIIKLSPLSSGQPHIALLRASGAAVCALGDAPLARKDMRGWRSRPAPPVQRGSDQHKT